MIDTTRREYTQLNMTQSYNLDSQVDFKYAIIVHTLQQYSCQNSVVNHVKLTQQLYSRQQVSLSSSSSFFVARLVGIILLKTLKMPYKDSYIGYSCMIKKKKLSGGLVLYIRARHREFPYPWSLGVAIRHKTCGPLHLVRGNRES